MPSLESALPASASPESIAPPLPHPDANRHSILELGNLLMVQERERFLLRLFRRAAITRLDEVRVFEAGCSTGYNLRQMVQWGGSPPNMAGIDIDPVAIEYCAAHSPNIRWHAGSAAAIPEGDGSFDLTLAFTLFSSVADANVASTIAAELFRITRPGGRVVIYDMRRRNPSNPDVHPIVTDVVRGWFPGCRIQRTPITLAPPLARLAGRYAPWLYGPLASIRPLRTHTMFVVRRPLLPKGGGQAKSHE